MSEWLERGTLQKDIYPPVNKHGKGKSLMNGDNGKIMYKLWWIFVGHVWCPEGNDNVFFVRDSTKSAVFGFQGKPDHINSALNQQGHGFKFKLHKQSATNKTFSHHVQFFRTENTQTQKETQTRGLTRKNSIRPGRKNAWFLLFGFCGAVFVLGRFRLAHHGLCWQMRFQLQHQLRAQRFGHAHRVGKCDRMAHGIGAGCAWEEPCEALKVTPPVWAWSLPRPTTKGSLIVR